VRTIRKRRAPNALTEWRAPRLAKDRREGMEGTYEEMRRDPRVLRAVEEGLFREQGGLCAYTGRRIRLETGTETSEVDLHLEHVIPQAHCEHGQDTAYDNLVACWPRANYGTEPSYGARKKGDWPSPAERHLFLSPLDDSCSARFSFNHRGEISPAMPDDKAAETTIEKLGLQNAELTALRANAIRGVLFRNNRPIGRSEARRQLRVMKADAAKLDRGESVTLQPYCFAIQQALAREIKKLEGIRQSQAKKDA
jgi:uncharacterized protein (TIGR02646 family)